MKISPKVIRNCLYTLTYTAVSLLVLAAILLSIARLMLPVVEDYKPDIESWVSKMVGQQVQIATLDAAWYGLEPQLVLKGVQLLSNDRTEMFGYFQQARIGLNIFGSIYEGRLKPGALTIEGAHLVVVRQVDGNVSISGLDKGGLTGAKKTSDNNQAISDWLFNQRLLDVKDSNLVWIDNKNDEPAREFSNVNLRFRNVADRHLVHGSVTLPEELGARLEVALDVRGDLVSARGWSGSAYVEGANLRLAQWLKDVSAFHASVSDGLIGLRLWGQWRKAELFSLKGEIFSNGIQLSVENEPKIQMIETFSSRIYAQKINTAWEATFDEIIISTAKTVWPTARVDARFDPEQDMLDADVSYINISDILPVVKLLAKSDSDISTLLSRLNPSGVVKQTHLLVRDMSQSPQYYVSAELSQVRSSPWKSIPGVGGLNARLSLNNEVFGLTLPPQNFVLNYTGVFSYPASLKNVSASVSGKSDTDGFSLVAKVDNAEYRGAATNGSLYFDFPTGQAPWLDLAFYFEHGRIKNAKYYIPAKIMNANAVDWISMSLLDGKVKTGGLLYYGSINDYPFIKNEGLFDLTLDVKNGKLLFAKDWPEITRINGEFNLSADSLSFYGKTAKSLKSSLSAVDLVLPSFRSADMKLIITGDISGRSEDKLTYLHASPLEEIFAKNVSPLEVTGQSQLKLSLDIPLADTTKTKVDGVVSIRNNVLKADDWNLSIDKLFADLRFDNQGVYANKVTGSMAGITFTGDINTLDEGNDYRKIVIAGEADIDKDQLTYLLGNYIDQAHWARYFSGKTKIKTAVNIPIQYPQTEEDKKISLSLSADTTDVMLSLPYPLDKQAGMADIFELEAELTGDKRLLTLKTNKINALFEMVPAGDTQVIIRGGIGFEQKPELPSENGYRFVGHLERFSWTQWQQIIFPEDDEVPLLSDDGAGGSQYFNVHIDNFEIFGSWFGKTSVQASSGSQLWSIHLSGEKVAGEVFIPVVLSSAPLVMNMDKLIVVRSAGDGNEETLYIDPRELPEIKIESKMFVFNDLNFGALNVVAKKIDDGLYLDKFLMKTKYTTISATGNWVEVDKKQTSMFDILVTTSHLGKTIKGWGFADAFGGGVGGIRLNANWTGNPSDFSFQAAAGNMDIDIKDTSLLDFDLGPAKMAGLFLPRRLLLDFRDVFNKGMHFDSIKGQYQIADGNAFTNDLTLDGPTADILMTGRIGLVAKDYDQLITVNRRLVGDSLSTLATLATNPLVNPLLAAQIYGLKKIFEKQIDDILSVQYTIKGPWESPQITPVVKNLENRGDTDEDLFE